MGWSYGLENGREVGYSVEAKCDHPECNIIINRGLSYRCGGTLGLYEDYGCSNFFCSIHSTHGLHDRLCLNCLKDEQNDEEE